MQLNLTTQTASVHVNVMPMDIKHKPTKAVFYDCMCLAIPVSTEFFMKLKHGYLVWTSLCEGELCSSMVRFNIGMAVWLVHTADVELDYG